ncbi:MAG: exonuclease domain-containing protein [Crocinitomicaceae bacterium]
MKYAIVDIETTGGTFKNTRITDIAILIHDGKKVIDEFKSLVNPEAPIPEFIVRLTGISDQMVVNAPKFYEIARQVVEITEDCVFVAHNVSFDYTIVRNEFKALGFDYRREHLCTVRASKYVIPGYKSYSLGKISKDLGIQIQDRHRAYGDALATSELFSIIIDKDPYNLEKFIQHEINPKKIHPQLDLNKVDELPTKTGVYYFFDENGTLIYIGKSKNIKSRVEQHLRNATTQKAIEMRENISEIKYELTGSELVALLKESDEIKAFKPKYNRAQRKTLYSYGMFEFEDSSGYRNLYIDRLQGKTDRPITVFTNKLTGKKFLERICAEGELCQKLCGLYNTNSSCFQYQIKECYGACVKEEVSESYNRRVGEAIRSLIFDAQNFIIIGKGRSKFEKSFVLVEDSVYKGYGFCNGRIKVEGPSNLIPYLISKEDNKDVSSIIRSHLRDKNTKNIVYF